MIFEHLENPEHKDQKLSILERSLIIALIPLAKILIWKAKRAKTYGDLMKIANFMENRIDSLEDQYQEGLDVKDDSVVPTIISEIEQMTKDLEE